MTLVSIVTPSYNQAGFLEQTIQSVVQQSHPEIEYLLVDGGSTDGSLEIIRRHAAQIAWWTSQKDRGQADAISTGLARAKGELVAWLNSDDYYLPGTIAEAVRAFSLRPDVAMIYGDILAVDETGRPFNVLRYKNVGLEDLLCFEIIGQPAVFLRREVIEAVGGPDPAFHLLLDHQLWIRVVRKFGALHMPRVWAAARYHPGAKNRARAREFGGEAFQILDWAAGDAGLAPMLRRLSPRPQAAAHRVQARYLLDAGDAGAALQAWSRSLVLWPPTALARLNIAASAVLQYVGLGFLRRTWLARRRLASSRRWKAP